MKKAHVLRIGDHNFVFGSAKAATAAYEILEAAEFHGTKSWRTSSRIIEVEEGLEVKTFNREELDLLSYEENKRLEAIESYKTAVTSRVYENMPDKRQKSIDRAAAVLLDLGIDPETIEIEEEEED